jgi:hypothetical protein
MHSANCQNCGEEVKGNYCANCGQKATTHRFSTRHILEHDFVHGVFHLDRGFLYTAKQLLTRPGYAIREYVEGKRVNHFNYITLILLLIAVQVFMYQSTGYDMTAVYPQEIGETKGMIQGMQSLMMSHMKEMYLLMIPLNSVITYFVFRKARQNYAEHLVLNSYLAAGLLMLQVCFVGLHLVAWSKTYSTTISVMMFFVTYYYTLTYYKQYFRKDYSSKLQLYIRGILAQALPIFTLMVIMFLFILVYTHLYSPGAAQQMLINMSNQGVSH